MANESENAPNKSEFPSKKDERIFVPKGDGGIGWTLNFENKWSYVILAAILGLVVFIIIYGYFFQK